MRFSSRKVGGIRFTRIGRLNISTSMSRPLPKLNDSARVAVDWIGLMLCSPLAAAAIIHLMAG